MAGQPGIYDPTDDVETGEFQEYGPTMDEPIPVEEHTGHEPVPDVLGAGWEDWLQSGYRPYDPTVDEELEAAGIDVEDLIPTDESEGADYEPPGAVAGWELTANEGDFISRGGTGGRPPAGFIADETTATVTALSHGGRWKHRSAEEGVAPRDGELLECRPSG